MKYHQVKTQGRGYLPGNWDGVTGCAAEDLKIGPMTPPLHIMFFSKNG